MNPAQLSFYRRLWADACRAQGWSKDDDALRRRIRFAAVGKESTRDLSEDEITRLYNRLRVLADPDNLTAVIIDSDPAASDEANRCRQHLHVIDGFGFADAYIVTCATGHCRAEKKNSWRALSSDSLESLRHTLTTRARQRDAKNGKRPEFVERVTPYHQRASTKAKRKADREPHVVPRREVAELFGDCPF